ncbi:sensory box histidine kinase/response regulator [hydrothermal vent metagenome]|uniref:Sensory box histidine kinase/response regulator n=1 Tax=hydrothermal vent metagenome TaxID=652676 RepID=A0A3B0VM05_9ZZZZ
MCNRIINFIQQSSVTKFFIVNFIIGAVLSVTGYFSLVLWIAVVFSFIPVFIGLPFAKDKLTYDQIQQVKFNSLLFSSLAWSLFMWGTLQAFPRLYTLVFVTLLIAALTLFRSLKQKIAIIVPIFIVFMLLIVFFLTPAAVTIALMAFAFVVLFLFFGASSLHSLAKEKKSSQLNSSTKVELVSELDSEKTDNSQLTDSSQLKEQIKKLKIKLSAAEMAKMEFLATMSHEIRTPLNGIIPLLDILLDSDLSDFQRDYLSTAHVSAIQMQKLIDDLLDYSKVEAGKLTVESRGLKVLGIMSAVNSSYQQAARKKGLTIEVDVHKNVSPLLRGDPTRLRQVLSNLLSNAIKFSNTGIIKLVATKLKDFPTKEVIRFEVIDQGMGLDKETSNNIFLPFTQEDGSSTRKFGGTGLGLAISKKIIELMQGSIYVDSIKGKGSNFYFDLPLLKSMGETRVGVPEKPGYHAILINTNPLLFNKVSQNLKSEDVPVQKALGLLQAYNICTSINKLSSTKKNILLFIDFETAGKQVRNLCSDLSSDKTISNMYVCILTDSGNIAGIPQHPNIKLISKNEPIGELLHKIEALQASKNTNSEMDAQLTDDAKGINTIKSTVQTQAPSSYLLPEVLLVEDNEVNLKVAEKLIQYIGYPFDVAMNGQEAFEKVKLNRYRMILMDCQMPTMDGYRCTAKIRDYEAAAGLNHTPILAMTANAMMGDREKCLNAGMDDYMSKPLNRYILEKTLKKWDPLAQSLTPDHTNGQPNTDTKNADKPVGELKKFQTVPVIKDAVAIKPNDKEAKAPSHPVPEINQKWLSSKALVEIREFMGDEIVSLLEMFEQETPSILNKMRTALKNNNFGEVKKMAHMLKSTSANIGANGLSFFSRKMELAAVNAEKHQLIIIFNKTKKAYILTSKEITKYINSL